MKKNEVNNLELNKMLTIGNKILKLTYYLIVFTLFGLILYIGDISGFFSVLLDILSVLMPMFAGFMIAWVLNPIVLKLESKGLGRAISSVTLIVLVFVAILVSFFAFIPVMYNQAQELITVLPAVITNMVGFIDNSMLSFANNGIDVSSINDSLNTYISELGTTLAVTLPTGIMNFIVNFIGAIVTFVLSLVLGLYILLDFDRIQENFLKILPVKNREETSLVLNKVSIETRKCINGILLIASIVALMCSVSFSIIGLDAALLLGIICGITNIIPYIGPWIGGGFAAMIGFTTSGAVGISILVLIFIVQSFESYVLQPLIMGRVISIHPVIIMVSLLVFGHFFGILGMILSTPTLAILKVVLSHFNVKYQIIKD
ncbi:MAG: AI-2E family transporter [bacterium]